MLVMFPLHKCIGLDKEEILGDWNDLGVNVELYFRVGVEVFDLKM
jgi:hypothetical protein